MPKITKVGRVMVPVSDQDEAIGFHTRVLGFSLVADVPSGENDRWVEVAPLSGGAAIALVPPQGEYQPGRMTGIALESPDPAADHSELRGRGVDVDAELTGGEATVPLLFFFRGHDKNQLMIVQARWWRGRGQPGGGSVASPHRDRAWRLPHRGGYGYPRS